MDDDKAALAKHFAELVFRSRQLCNVASVSASLADLVASEAFSAMTHRLVEIEAWLNRLIAKGAK